MDSRDGGLCDSQNNMRIDELIRSALTQSNTENREEIIRRLQEEECSEIVFSIARELCFSDKPVERALGAEILGFLGFPNRPYIRESAEILSRVLMNESDSDVIYYAIDALRHLEDFCAIGNIRNPECKMVILADFPAIIPLVLPFKDHADKDVRVAVALALGAGLLNVPGYEDKSAIEALIELSADEDRDVRDWATFELAAETLAEVNWAGITEALWKRVHDIDPKVRSEALLGLVYRRAEGILEPLIRELSWQATQDNVADYALEAAYELADPHLCEILQDIKKKADYEVVEKALRACRCGITREMH